VLGAGPGSRFRRRVAGRVPPGPRTGCQRGGPAGPARGRRGCRRESATRGARWPAPVGRRPPRSTSGPVKDILVPVPPIMVRSMHCILCQKLQTGSSDPELCIEILCLHKGKVTGHIMFLFCYKWGIH